MKPQMKSGGDLKENSASQGTLKDPRKRELEKISAENILLMNKIDNIKSIYGADQYINHNMKRREVLELRCEYPLIIEKEADKGSVATYNC